MAMSDEEKAAKAAQKKAEAEAKAKEAADKEAVEEKNSQKAAEYLARETEAAKLVDEAEKAANEKLPAVTNIEI